MITQYHKRNNILKTNSNHNSILLKTEKNGSSAAAWQGCLRHVESWSASHLHCHRCLQNKHSSAVCHCCCSSHAYVRLITYTNDNYVIVIYNYTLCKLGLWCHCFPPEMYTAGLYDDTMGGVLERFHCQAFQAPETQSCERDCWEMFECSPGYLFMYLILVKLPLGKHTWWSHHHICSSWGGHPRK